MFGKMWDDLKKGFNEGYEKSMAESAIESEQSPPPAAPPIAPAEHEQHAGDSDPSPTGNVPPPTSAATSQPPTPDAAPPTSAVSPFGGKFSFNKPQNNPSNAPPAATTPTNHPPASVDSPASHLSASSQVEALLDQADDHACRDEFRAAHSALDKALEIDASSSFVRISRATAYLSQNRYHDVIKECSTIIGMDSRNPGAFYFRGVGQLRLDRPVEAVADFDRCIAFEPNELYSYVDRAHALLMCKRYTEAVRDCDHVISTDSTPRHESPKHEESDDVLRASFFRLSALYKLGNTASLQASANKFVEQFPKSDKSWLWYAICATINKDFKEAMRATHNAIGIADSIYAIHLRINLNVKIENEAGVESDLRMLSGISNEMYFPFDWLPNGQQLFGYDKAKELHASENQFQEQEYYRRQEEESERSWQRTQTAFDRWWQQVMKTAKQWGFIEREVTACARPDYWRACFQRNVKPEDALIAALQDGGMMDQWGNVL